MRKALMLLALALLAACGGATGSEEFTQCFLTYEEMQCSKWLEGRDFCHSLESRLYRDSKRSCYGQRWKIPRGYYAGRWIAYGSITESFSLYSRIPELDPGRHLSSQVRREWTVKSLSTKTFAQRAAEVLAARLATHDVQKSDRKMFAMDVYIPARNSPDQYKDFIFVPYDGAKRYVICLARPTMTVDDLRSDSPCRVVSNVAELVSIEYQVVFSELKQLAQIDARVVKLMTSFMLPAR